MSRLAVIIPFYQSKKGLLVQALRSALLQKGEQLSVHVFVIDDASPIPADGELAELLPEERLQVTLIEQANQGPAGARNTGLAQVSKDFDFIAFLDSDDVWSAQHLERAVWALNQGFDLYFSDYNSYERENSFFTYQKGKGHFNQADHKALLGRDGFYVYQTSFFEGLIKANFVGTSTLVYRWANLGHLRFNPQLFNAEDEVFLLEAAIVTNKIVFSSEPEVTYGRGINICSQWSTWGNPQALKFFRNHYTAQYHILNNFQLNPTLKKQNLHKQRKDQVGFCQNLFNFLIRRKVPVGAWGYFLEITRKDLLFPFLFVRVGIAIILQKATGVQIFKESE